MQGAEIDKAQDLWYSLVHQIRRCGIPLRSVGRSVGFFPVDSRQNDGVKWEKYELGHAFGP